MPRRFFRRVSDGYQLNQKDQAWYVKPFSALFAHPTFFSVSRRSVAGGIWVGLFLGLIPMPAQTVFALLIAFLLRVNVPLAGLTVWVTNPLTMVPIFYSEYRLGALIMDMPLRKFEIALSWDWLTTGFLGLWKPLMLGAFITATVVGSLAYVIISVIWRLTVAYRYKRRHMNPG